jgi:hypothetical protein
VLGTGSYATRQQEQQKKDKDFSKLKSAVKFVTDKINAVVISYPSSEVISNDKGLLLLVL